MKTIFGSLIRFLNKIKIFNNDVATRKPRSKLEIKDALDIVLVNEPILNNL
jgi:hypothetical protein